MGSDADKLVSNFEDSFVILFLGVLQFSQRRKRMCTPEMFNTRILRKIRLCELKLVLLFELSLFDVASSRREIPLSTNRKNTSE